MEQPVWVDRPTANLSKRRRKISLIVLHHTGGTMPGDLAWLTSKASHVSADFLVCKDETIYKLNPQLRELQTWHAGVSEWRGRKNCNGYSVGIEQEHRPGDVWTDAQVEACAKLCGWLVQRFDLDLDAFCIQSHAAVAVPHGRKTDPENFPWTRFGELVRGFLG